MGQATSFDGLFDLETDPREEHNVIGLYPEVNLTRVLCGVLIRHFVVTFCKFDVE